MLYDLCRGLILNDYVEPLNEGWLSCAADLTFGFLCMYFLALYTANLKRRLAISVSYQSASTRAATSSFQWRGCQLIAA